jgi:gliding motility-associated-like protein
MLKKLALRIGIYVALLTIPATSLAQNLVPNPSFESYNSCPISIGGLDYSPSYSSFPTVQGWVSPMPTSNGSPDYFNTCAALSSGVHVPEITFGYQNPRSGKAFAGIIAWEGKKQGTNWVSDVREYIQCKLTQPMQAGKKYCVSFYVNPSISSVFNFNYVSIDAIGINFSNTQLLQPNGYVITAPVHVSNAGGNYLSDTANWIRISGNYIASGGEQWLTLGCFTNGPPAFVQAYPPLIDPLLNYRSYMYIDDVTVLAVGANDTVKSVSTLMGCDSNNAVVALKSTTNGGTHTWSTGDNTESISALRLGTYWCRTVTECQVFLDTFHVMLDPTLKLSLGKDTGNCFNQPVTLTVNPTAFSSFLWSTGSTTNTAIATQTGYYYLTATNKCGVQKDTIHVSIQPPTPAPVVRDTMFCQMVRDPKINVEGEGIKWYLSYNGVIGNPVQPLIHTLEPGSDVIYVSQTKGYCESERVPLNIKIKYQPKEELPNDLTMCPKYAYKLGNEKQDVTYKWSTGESVCCIVPNREGVYRRASTNECGSYIDSIKVTFSECDQCIVMPSAFTPNRDGRNDKISAIVTCPIGRFHMMIFNRWGNKLFDTNDPQTAWDGTVNGVMSDEGTYIYVIDYSSASTYRTNMLKGTFVLIR